MSKKKEIISKLFAYCKERDNFVFHNDMVKEISASYEFKNPFDATKTDNLSVLPDDIRAEGYCILHLGKGFHQFVKCIEHCFHKFEKIHTEKDWPYRRSVLNEHDTSESNILSVGFNQKIVHDFLYDDVNVSPKMYGSRRTKITVTYNIGMVKINATQLQVEVDLTTEYRGVVTVFEAKNKFPKNFAVYQLFNPFLYFHQLKEIEEIAIKKINCCYLLRSKKDGNSIVRLYLYEFSDANDMASIKLLKSTEYKLIQR